MTLDSWITQIVQLRSWWWLLPLGVFWAGGNLWLVGQLRSQWPVAWTRKLFHLVIFSSAAFLQLFADLAAVMVFGVAVGIVVSFAVYRNGGAAAYEALARPADGPWRGALVLLAFTATALGGLASNTLFGSASVAGYLVCGLGDAAGEPVGHRWGKHRFRVPFSARGVWKSLEGTAAVALVSWLALLVAVPLLAPRPQTITVVPLLGLMAIGCAAVEALSPRGSDNFTVQVAGSGLFQLAVSVVD